MSPHPPPPRRFPTKSLLAGAVLATALLLWWLLPSGASADTPPSPSAPTASAPANPSAATRPAMPLTAPQAPAAPVADSRPAPVIDEITVEKQEVCSGEENLVSIRAHTVDGTDDHLHYVVGSDGGQRMPVRIWKNMDGTYQVPTVSVFGRDNVATHVPLPAYKVKDCEPLRNALVSSQLRLNTVDEYEFQVRVVDVAAKKAPQALPFEPVRYVWNWGDGATETTEKPMAVHRFGGQDMEKMYFQYLVSVEAVAANGERVKGRVGMQVLNSAYENYVYRNIVTVLGEGTPRFPVLGADGVVRQTFRLFHYAKGPVRITRVIAVRSGMPGPDHQSAPASEEAHETAELALSVIPPGKGVEISVTLDTKAEPDLAMISYELEGVSEDGHTARGSFSVMRPPEPPTKEKHLPVTDPLLIAKIKRAQQLLKQQFVTGDDLDRLESEGKFDDLMKAQRAPSQGG
jgi:hypothetical protein